MMRFNRRDLLKTLGEFYSAPPGKPSQVLTPKSSQPAR